MKKIMFMICFGIMAAFLFTACSNHTDTNSEKIESLLGYQLTYRPELFVLAGGEEVDTFQYVSEDTILNAPVYFSVQRYKDMDAATLIDGLILQFAQIGVNGVEAEDTYIGEDHIEAKSITIERAKYETIWTQVFYAIPQSSGSILVQISRYKGMPREAKRGLKEMLDSFSLKTEEER